MEPAPDGARVRIVDREKIVARLVGNVKRNSEGESDPRQTEIPVNHDGQTSDAESLRLKDHAASLGKPHCRAHG
jgi:hypothetical protein